MSDKPIAVASDHAGFDLKEHIRKELLSQGHKVIDLGTYSTDSVDYPDYGLAMGKSIENNEADTGILVCGSGIGISIAANRNKAVRAALCHSGLSARLARQHNNANVLALGARLTGVDTAMDCVAQFLDTEFEGGRHARRVAKMSD